MAGNWDEVKTITGYGATIGSHNHEHFILNRNQCKELMNTQLEISKKKIIEKTGRCNYFAYPNGGKLYTNIDAVKSVIENRYLLGFTSIPGEILNETNRYILPRMGGEMDLDHFRYFVDNSYIYNLSYRKWCAQFGKLI